MEESQNNELMRELLHKLVNKTVTTQSLLRLLSKSELTEEQADMVVRSKEAVDEMIKTVKEIREHLR